MEREEMVLLMEEFARSGQTQKDFSASKGMNVHKFSYWFRKLKKERETPSGFARVDTGAAPAGPNAQAELVFPNGVRLRVDASDVSLLSRLVRLY